MTAEGLLIVCEGLDCSGKTTTIKRLIEDKPNNFIYSKGIGSDSCIGRFSRRHPSTLTFYLELLCNTATGITPNLRNGKIILQDRYNISIDSYVPAVNKWYNQLFINLFRPFLVEPDAIVYFHLPLEERIKRLKEKGTGYELMLANYPELIVSREKEYERWFHDFVGSKIDIDTDKNDIESSVKILRDFIKYLR